MREIVELIVVDTALNTTTTTTNTSPIITIDSLRKVSLFGYGEISNGVL